MRFKLFILLSLLSNFLIVSAQELEIEVVDTLCIDQNTVFLNNSNPAYNVEWDFCLGDLSETPSTTNIGTLTDLNTPFGIHFVDRKTAFLPSNGSNSLFRLTFSDGFNQEPDLENVGNLSGLLNRATSITFLDSLDVRYGFIVNKPGSIIRFKIDSTNNVISGSEVLLGDYGVISSAENIYGVIDAQGSYKLLVLHRGNISIIDLGTNPSSIGTISTIPLEGASRLWGIDLKKFNLEWIALVTDFSNGSIYHINFGSRVSDVVSSITKITTEPFDISASGDIQIINDGVDYISILQTRAGSQFRLNFQDDLTSTDPIIDELGNYGLLSLNSSVLSAVYDSSRWNLLSINFTNERLHNSVFHKECGFGIEYSQEDTLQFSINQSGSLTYSVSLLLDSTTTQLVDSLVILDSSAPLIALSTDNTCVSSNITFTPSITGLASYHWDFGDGNTSAEESPAHQYTVAGNYTVILDVDDGTCGNFIEEEITIYDEPEVPQIEIQLDGAGSPFCSQTAISLNTLTDYSSLGSDVSFSWTINDAIVLDARDTLFAFASPGTNEVSLTVAIPGCAVTTSQTVEILEGPGSAFTNGSTCQGEMMRFTNLSFNAESFEWDFGDGTSSTAFAPDHVYDTSGIFDVSLTATDLNGCQNTVVEQVIIDALPEVSFSAVERTCTASEGIRFVSESFVPGNTDVVAWEWFINEQAAAIGEQAVLFFSEPGEVDITLEAESSAGCLASHTETFIVYQSPAPQFSIEVGCEGEMTRFVNETSVNGDPINNVRWMINGTTYDSAHVSLVFDTPGIYEASLEVSTIQNCTETITEVFEVLPLPEPMIGIVSNCANEQVMLLNQTGFSVDSLIAKRWYLNNELVGVGDSLNAGALDIANYDLELEVETESGCLVSTTETLMVNASPEASFDISSLYAAPGDLFTLINTSAGASTYEWVINNEPVSIRPDMASFALNRGNYSVGLIATNEFNCSDTALVDIIVAEPVMDIAIEQLSLLPTENEIEIFIELKNNSSLPVDQVEVAISLQNDFEVSETLELFLGLSESQLVKLNVALPLTTDAPSYICANVAPIFRTFQDISLEDNEACINVAPILQVTAPYPNPVLDVFEFRAILNDSGSSQIELLNAAGKVQFTYAYDVNNGLNVIPVDMSGLNAGLYFLRFSFKGNVTLQKVIKLTQ